MAAIDPEEQRTANRRSWEGAAGAWGQWATRIREWGMPVSTAMIDALVLAPGQRVLELAAGPGDTGFIAAQRLGPDGRLISSDGAEAMLAVARGRAERLGIENVEFRQLELEWIDLPAADVDAILCRWGIMLTVDPAAAAREMRRVLRPGGRVALAVWDERERNPWATIPGAVLVELGHAAPPDPDAPGMFSLAPAARLAQLLDDAGFTEVEVNAVEVVRDVPGVQEYVAETSEISPSFGPVYRELDATEQAKVVDAIAAGAAAFTAADGSLKLPGSSLVASATA